MGYGVVSSTCRWEPVGILTSTTRMVHTQFLSNTHDTMRTEHETNINYCSSIYSSMMCVIFGKCTSIMCTLMSNQVHFNRNNWAAVLFTSSTQYTLIHSVVANTFGQLATPHIDLSYDLNSFHIIYTSFARGCRCLQGSVGSCLASCPVDMVPVVLQPNAFCTRHSRATAHQKYRFKQSAVAVPTRPADVDDDVVVAVIVRKDNALQLLRLQLPLEVLVTMAGRIVAAVCAPRDCVPRAKDAKCVTVSHEKRKSLRRLERDRTTELTQVSRDETTPRDDGSKRTDLSWSQQQQQHSRQAAEAEAVRDPRVHNTPTTPHTTTRQKQITNCRCRCRSATPLHAALPKWKNKTCRKKCPHV